MLVVTGLVPARLSLGDALDRLDAPLPTGDDAPEQWWVRLFGVPLVDTGVGRAATLSMVGAAVLVLAFNYVLSTLFVEIGF